MDVYEKSLELHKKAHGKLCVECKVPLNGAEDLSLAYSPGVAQPCLEINKDYNTIYDYTAKGNMVAVVTNGTAVLGLGNIGAGAGLPVMEGKAVLFKSFAGVDAFPICLDTMDPDKIVETVKLMEPTFGGVNLEDIKAPECFYIENKLKEICNIPIFHDDQHGTAIVTLAGLLNALKVVGKDIKDLHVVVSGAGAAAIAITKLLLSAGIADAILCDSKGAIYEGRDGLNDVKVEMSKITNAKKLSGSLADVIKGADVFVGVSAPGVLTQDMIKTMAAPCAATAPTTSPRRPRTPCGRATSPSSGSRAARRSTCRRSSTCSTPGRSRGPSGPGPRPRSRTSPSPGRAPRCGPGRPPSCTPTAAATTGGRGGSRSAGSTASPARCPGRAGARTTPRWRGSSGG